MTLPKSFVLDSIKAQVSDLKKFEEANLSFLANMNDMNDIKRAFKLSFNQLSKKKLTPKLTLQLFDCLDRYARIIEKMSIVELTQKVNLLQEDAKEICDTYSLPSRINEDNANQSKMIDLKYYDAGLNGDPED